MHAAQTLLKRVAPIDAAASICARASISRRPRRRAQVAMDEPHALERDAIGQWMKARRAERFEAWTKASIR